MSFNKLRLEDVFGESGLKGPGINKESIMEGYCVKCKAKREIVNAKEVKMKAKGGKQRPALKGACGTCDTVIFRILPSK